MDVQQKNKGVELKQYSEEEAGGGGVEGGVSGRTPCLAVDENYFLFHTSELQGRYGEEAGGGGWKSCGGGLGQRVRTTYSL